MHVRLKLSAGVDDVELPAIGEHIEQAGSRDAVCLVQVIGKSLKTWNIGSPLIKDAHYFAERRTQQEQLAGGRGYDDSSNILHCERWNSEGGHRGDRRHTHNLRYIFAPGRQTIMDDVIGFFLSHFG